MLEIIQKPESKPDEEELFCLSLAAKLRKIKDPKKKEYAQLQLQQTLYNCMYGDDPQPEPEPQLQSQLQPQQLPQQKLWTINKVLLHQAYKVIIIP